MSINPVNYAKTQYTNNNGTKAKEVKEKDKEATGEQVAAKDNFDKTDFSIPGTISNKDVVDGRLTTDALKKINAAEVESKTNFLRDMLSKVEGNTKDKVLGQTGAMKPTYTGFEADDTYGVEAVANNLVDFAKALSGGDPENIGMLKDSVIKGFEAAVGSDRSKWADITTKTFDKAMSLFDEWENESATPVEPPTENSDDTTVGGGL